MAFIPPIAVIRRNLIVRKLRECGAVSPETAKTLREVGVINPDGMWRFTERLVKKRIIKRTDDGRYYI